MTQGSSFLTFFKKVLRVLPVETDFLVVDAQRYSMQIRVVVDVNTL